MNDLTNKSFSIYGGKSSGGKGGYVLIAEDIDIDFRQSYTTPIKLVVKGGDGKYPGGAIKGRNIYLVAGDDVIKPGVGTVADPGIVELDDNYTATVEVLDGGKLVFGKSKAGSVISHRSESTISGFSKSQYYGPAILARGNSEVELYGGWIHGATDNISPADATVPQAPTIHMGRGKLTAINETEGAGEYSENTDQKLIITGGTSRGSTPMATVVSDGEILLSGNTSIEGPHFPEIKGSTIYSDNPLASKRGAAGIYSTGYIHVTKGAHVMGGRLNNIADEVKDSYRYGSGIVGNGQNTVRVDNGATVQGYGSTTYSKENQKQIKLISVNEDIGNMSAGHGIENVGTVIVDGGNVHGGDIHTPASPSGQTGAGTGGVGIKGVVNVQISGTSLVTGGSSTGPQTSGGLRKPLVTNYMKGMKAGSAIENNLENPTGRIEVSGLAQIYGGTSAAKGGNGIAGYADVQISDEVTVMGGASKQEAGSGISKSINVTMEGGTVEAGNTPFQSLMTDYYDLQWLNYKWTKVYYPDALHADSKWDAPGSSTNAVAIEASGEVVVDGTGTTTPKINSYAVDFAASSSTELVSSPVVRLTDDEAILYVGKANATGPTEKSNLVEGGRYHVDIFKENKINTRTVVDGKDEKGIHYNDKSVGLYRILKNDQIPPTDEKIIGMEFVEFKGLRLYPEGQSAPLIIKQYIRKNAEQSGPTAVNPDEENKSLKAMPDDNIVLGLFEVKFMKNTDNLGDTEEQLIKTVKALELRDGKWHIQDSEFPKDLTYTDSKGKTYTLKGWNRAKDGTGEEFTSASAVTGDMEVYAQWEKDAGEDTNPIVPIIPIPDIEEIVRPETDRPFATGSLLIEPEKSSSKDIEPKNVELHKAYIKGYPDGTVLPQGNMTRAEAAAMVTRLANLDLSNEMKPDFADVDANGWYNKYLNAALRANMLDSENSKLRPDDKITRAEFAKMLAAIDKDTTTTSDFTDIKGHKYEKEINKISGNKRIQGYEDGTFRPDAQLTRAEATTMLNRMYNRVADEEAIRGYENTLIKFTDLNQTDWYYYEIVEAANTHKLIRRESKDRFDRIHEDWTEIVTTIVE